MATFISEGKVVTIRYDLHDGGPGGELLERMDVNYPFTFLFGNGNLLPAFEEELNYLHDRARFAFTLTPDKAYGAYRPDQILRLHQNQFADREGNLAEGLLTAGNSVRLSDKNGRQHSGKVIRRDGEEVLVDFNHVMAGKSLYFTGAVLHVRDATPDELVRGHHFEDTGLRRKL